MNAALCQYYRPNHGAYDELLDHGVPRLHWADFLAAHADLGIGEYQRRWQEAQSLIRENGVTYNVYGDPRGTDRPWRLDPMPVLYAAREWDRVATGLTQRARLLEAILADLYGPQNLLRNGLLPPDLVFAHPGFLRPCHGLRPQRHLYLYAADLGRAADGTFYVLHDRTQAPSGSGYALENRLVLSRMLPEAFRRCRVQRLATFFRSLRDTLQAAAPRHRDNPRIVLLTPGPYNEAYFEHGFLARYLGYTLVEGGDLTVRDGRVYLKLLGGLQPVDVILRRMDGDYCDPLELRADSFLGVPGLVQAIRAGNVVVANPLGSGLADSPAMLPFLPRLCRELLGEELRIPSAPAWWCGDPAGLSHVLANLSRLAIKPAWRGPGRSAIFGDRLDQDGLNKLADKIRAAPREFVGQEVIGLSTAPVLHGAGFQARNLVTRAFLVAVGDSFAVMPGGLTRVAPSADSRSVSMQQGGGSKDTWILADGPVSTFSLLPSAARGVILSRGGGDLPSRAADNLFWLGRYAERAEGLVRLLRGIFARLAERPAEESPELPPLIRALKAQTHESVDGSEADLRSLVFDAERKGGLAEALVAVGRVASTTRDRISHDMWRGLSALPALADPSSRRTPGEVMDLLNEMIAALAAFGGLAVDSMTRGPGWRFLDMGRRLERALHSSDLLNATLVRLTPHEGPLLEALLEIADSSMTYRRRYLGSLEAGPVLDLLLADESNPRSVAFQYVALGDGVGQLPRPEPRPSGRSADEKLVLAGLTALRLADINDLALVSAENSRPRLEELLKRLIDDLPALSEAMTRQYLTHLQPARHLLGGGLS